MSSFAPVGFEANLADVLTLLRLQGLVETRSPAPCRCGEPDRLDGSFAQHLLTCSRVCGSTRVYRHNLVLCALYNNLLRFGLMAVLEPSGYEYEDGAAKRPDLVVYVDGAPVTTDLVISIDPENAIKLKKEKHEAAVNRRGHIFTPIAMDIWGLFHPSIYVFLRKALASLQPRLRKLAILQTMRAMSEAWMAGTAAMLNNTANEATRRNFNISTQGTIGNASDSTSEARFLAVERFFAAV
jgi:hypothetical protein